MTRKVPELVERIVVGNKDYTYVDYTVPEGERPHKVARPGDVVKVTIACALAFPHRLQDPVVANANAEAARVTFEAAEAARQAEVDARRNPGVVAQEDDDEDDEDED